MKALFLIGPCIVLTYQLAASTPDSSNDTFDFPTEKYNSQGEIALNRSELQFLEGARQGFLRGQLERMKGLIKEEKDWEFLKNTIKEFNPERRVSTILAIQKSSLPEEVKALAVRNLDASFLYKNLTLKTLELLDLLRPESNQGNSDK